jgi:hypothetical protein
MNVQIRSMKKGIGLLSFVVDDQLQNPESSKYVILRRPHLVPLCSGLKYLQHRLMFRQVRNV